MSKILKHILFITIIGITLIGSFLSIGYSANSTNSTNPTNMIVPDEGYEVTSDGDLVVYNNNSVVKKSHDSDGEFAYTESDHVSADYYPVFCCALGTHLPGKSDFCCLITNLYRYADNSTGDSLVFTPGGYKYKINTILSDSSYFSSPGNYIDYNSIYENKVFKKKFNSSNGKFTTESFGFYKSIVGKKTATPKEAYILAEMKYNSSWNSYVQVAWWSTDAGNNGTQIPENPLALEADAFETYVNNVKDIADQISKDSPDSKASATNPENLRSDVEATKVIDEYKTAWNKDEKFKSKSGEEYNLKNPTVVWDTEANAYKVGPFSIKYAEAKAKIAAASEATFKNIDAGGVLLYGADKYKDSLALCVKERDEVIFSEITNADVLCNVNAEWEFIWLEGERKETDTYKYPHSDEVFYISVKKADGLKKISNIHFDFRYMNAAAQYQPLEGRFFTYTWDTGINQSNCSGGKWVEVPTTITTTSNCTTCGGSGYVHNYISIGWAGTCTVSGCGDILNNFVCSNGCNSQYGICKKNSHKINVKINNLDCCKCSACDGSGTVTTQTSSTKLEYQNCNHGFSSSHIISQTLYCKLTNIDENKSQPLMCANFGVRWYNTATLDFEPDVISFGKIIVEKQIVDENGNIIQAPDLTKYFRFQINVAGESPEIISVKAGETAESKVYYWTGSAPSYTVTEITDSEYERVSMSGSSGTLTSGEVKVVAQNRKIHKGKLSITKKVEGTDNISDKFTVNVELKGNFSIGGTNYSNYTITFQIGNNDTKTTDEIVWYGDTAPTYKVTEFFENDSKYELSNIEFGEGELSEDSTISVNVFNKMKENKAKLKIIKTLENEAGLTKEYIESLFFSFKITVDGYGESVVKLTPLKTDSGYEWVYESDNYVWFGSEADAPSYTIEEVDIPEGTEPAGSSSASGKLIANEENEYVVENKFINRVIEKKGSLQIKKIISGESLQNMKYKFKVGLKGDFTFNGTTYTSDKTYYLTNSGISEDIENRVIIDLASTDSASWSSSEIKWYDEAPTYTVEEDIIGIESLNSETDNDKLAEIKNSVYATINPSSGKLSDEGNVTVVTAENRITKKRGGLHIIKKLENSENLSIDYINSLEFSFKITVGEQEYETGKLEPKYVNGEFIWEYYGEYTWNENESNPKYSIEEINIPEGTEFVSANGSSGNGVSGTLKSDAEENWVIENTFINKVSDEGKEGSLSIIKKVLDDSIKDKSFKFKIEISGTFSIGGEKIVNGTKEIETNVSSTNGWSSGTITWSGDAPSYVVTEVLEEDDKAKNVSIINSAGKIADGVTQTVTAINDSTEQDNKGRISITKKVSNDAEISDSFEFSINVDGYNSYNVSLKAGETYTSPYFTWGANEKAPSYEVKEIKTGTSKQTEISNSSGKLSNETTIEIVCKNELKKHSGNIDISKEIIVDEKLSDEDIKAKYGNCSFTVMVTIHGNFEYNGKTYHKDTGDLIITQSISANSGCSISGITWYGDDAPVYSVNEINIPKNWKLIGISNNNGQLTDGGTSEVVATNKYETESTLDFTLELGGMVWNDGKENEKEAGTKGTTGIRDDDECGIADVEVLLYNASGTLVRTVCTNRNGYWNSGSLDASVKYYVVFRYDGQTYEPTELLASGSVSAYTSGKTSRNIYKNDSMAEDTNREEVNSRISEIYGGSAINSSGSTIGKVASTSGKEENVYYKSKDFTLDSEYSRKVSTLQTLNEGGFVYDLYKAEASTKQAGIMYPCDNKFHLESYDKQINELGSKEIYHYSATYEYCLNINLGLIEREDADIGVIKDLDSAKVIVNDSLINYKFGSLADLTGDVITRQIKAEEYINTKGISYELGFYKTDYYYRAEIYKTDGTVYDAKNSFYKEIGQTLDDTELDVFLKYKITIYNESSSYVEKINSINDYFDSSLDSPVDTKIYRYVETEDGNTVKGSKLIAEPSTVNGSEIKWTVEKRNIVGSNGVTYNKMKAEFDGLELNSGEYATIYVTFKVKKENIDAVKNCVTTGKKSNIVEIANYSTYKDGELAGKIDVDSAPDNINIRDYNERKFYEDDTDSAIDLNVILNEDTPKSISGFAWEDNKSKQVDGQYIGDGVYSGNESKIEGLTTELVEKVSINDSSNKKYDFLWPTNVSLNALGGKTVEQISGFDSEIETGSTGEYKFTGVPYGEFIVRFRYGNDKTTLEDKDDVTLNTPRAVGNSDYNKSLTANYDEDLYGITSAVYNGNDYKTSMYVEGGNVARDSEARRLEIIANSVTITNSNGTVLSSAESLSADHTELFNDYSMYADTESIIINRDTDDNTENVNIGLEKRPVNKVVLDKQIENIKIITSDGKTVFNAKYNITYEETSDFNDDCTLISKLRNGKYLVAKVELNKDDSINIDVLQSINKVENKTAHTGIQNFRYINIDTDILQGSTILIKYKFTAINVGEVDRVNEKLYSITSEPTTAKEKLLVAANDVVENNLEYGTYLGTTYYTGNPSSNEQIVTTNIRKLIDYVDNDAIYTASMNGSNASGWNSATINEVLGNGFEADRLLDKKIIEEYSISDNNEGLFYTKENSNILTSIDNEELSSIVKELVPYDLSKDNCLAEISLVISKVVASETDLTILAFENITEVVKYTSTAGRRSILATPGNLDPNVESGVFIASLKEIDSSATEIVTLTPPTGISTYSVIQAQIIYAVLIGITLLVVGIILIKKKVI